MISVDIEATGRTPGKYSMYELGAVTIGRAQTFERQITLLPKARSSLAALRAAGTTKETLERRHDAISPKQAMKEFAEWAKQQCKPGQRPLFVANNAPFDWMFVAWYFAEYGITNPFGHAALDMKAYFMGLTKCSWKNTTLKNMATHVGVKFEELPHNALLDADIQGRIFQKLITNQLTKELL